MGDYRIASGDYVLGHSAAENQRLAAQADSWASETRSALARVGLSSGMSALDVGCGTGATMRLMADAVGPGGAVTGMDRDGQVVAAALEKLRHDGPDIFRFIEADLSKIDHIDGAPFDLVFARFLLFHMRDPVAVLARLWSWVKPGGTLLVMDYDMLPMRMFPSRPAYERARLLTHQIWTASGVDIEVGSRMPSLFVQAGIGVPDACMVAGHIETTEIGVARLRSALSSLRDAAIALAVATASTMDAVQAELADLQRSDALFIRRPDLISTSKRKSLDHPARARWSGQGATHESS